MTTRFQEVGRAIGLAHVRAVFWMARVRLDDGDLERARDELAALHLALSHEDSPRMIPVQRLIRKTLHDITSGRTQDAIAMLGASLGRDPAVAVPPPGHRPDSGHLGGPP